MVAANRTDDQILLAQRIAERVIMLQAYNDRWSGIVTYPEILPTPGSLAPAHFPIGSHSRAPSVAPLPKNANRDPILLPDHGQVSITPQEHGDTFPIAKTLIAEKGYSYAQARADEFTDREMRKMYLAIKAAADANPNEILAGGAADVDALGADDVCSLALLKRARVVLSSEQSAPRFSDVGAMGSYRALLPTEAIADLGHDKSNVNGMADVAKYVAPELALAGEIGMLEGFRLIEQPSDLVTALGAANGTADLLTAHFVGMYAVAGVINSPVRVFYEPRPGDTEMRFDQFRSYGIYGFGALRPGNGLIARMRSYNTANN